MKRVDRIIFSCALYPFLIISLNPSQVSKSTWAATWQNQQCGCVPSEDLAVRMKKAWVLSYPISTQRRLWSDWADAQADLSLQWAHTNFACRCSIVEKVSSLLETTWPNKQIMALSQEAWQWHTTVRNCGTWKNCCNYPKTSTMWFYHREMCPMDADGMTNSADPD